MKLYVNAVTGNDLASGSQSAPFKTLTHALQQAQPQTLVYIAPGIYHTANGEVFPLYIPAKVSLIGYNSSQEQEIKIVGGGADSTSDLEAATVTIVMGNHSILQGVTITNPQFPGIGVLIRSVHCTLRDCQLVQSKQNGISIEGTAIIDCFDNFISENGQNGIIIQGNTKGEIRNNQLINNGCGIQMKDDAAPLIINNQIKHNQTGIILADDCKPVLRHNQIEDNDSEGITLMAQPQPDFGHSQDPGLNIIRNNGLSDLQNASSLQLLSVGNQINPAKVQGNIKFDMSEVSLNLPKPNSENIFNDITGHWAEEFILRLAQLKIISGFPDNTFRPDEFLTRAQYAALLGSSFDLLPIQKATNFMDIPENFWAKKAILIANQAGFLVGFPDSSFRPHQNLTRIQVIVSLVKGLKLSGGISDILTMYRDRDLIPSYAIDAVATATVKKLVVNYPHPAFLSPQRSITRAEIAAILYQALVLQKRESAINSPYIICLNNTIEGNINCL